LLACHRKGSGHPRANHNSTGRMLALKRDPLDRIQLNFHQIPMRVSTNTV
jgi:hypothetical protein